MKNRPPIIIQQNTDLSNNDICDVNLPEHIEREIRIQEQNKRFQVICSSKNDAIITSDESKMILFWNNGAEHIFGYTTEEAVGQPLTLIIPEDLRGKHEKGIERMNQRRNPRVIGKVLELRA